MILEPEVSRADRFRSLISFVFSGDADSSHNHDHTQRKSVATLLLDAHECVGTNDHGVDIQ